MAFKIEFDNNNNPIEPTFLLANRNGNKLGAITNIHNTTVDGSIDTPQVSFDVSKYDNGNECHLWNEIKDFKLLYCKEWDFWFEIKIELSSKDETVKSVMGTALSQSELSQIMLYGIEINTEDDIAREDYTTPTIIYNESDPKASLLNRIIEKAPHYTIAHVDNSLKNIQRTFSFDNTSIKDALNEIAEEIHCLVVYGNGTKEVRENGITVPERTISLYDLESVCIECGYRGDFLDVCPSCGGKNIISGYGEDTTIFVAKDNLTQDIVLTGDADSVKNCFRLEAGDDLMTATVRNCNPNGGGYIWSITDEMKSDMPKELADKLTEYDTRYKNYNTTYQCVVNQDIVKQYNALVNKYRIYDKTLPTIDLPIVGYPTLMNDMYNIIDFNLYLSDSLMPDVGIAQTTAEEQIAILSDGRLSPIAVSNTNYISNATADSNVLAMTKIYVDSRYKVSIKESSFDMASLTWRGTITVTNYSDEDDTATSNTLTVKLNDDFEKFVKQKVDAVLHKGDNEDYSITGIMGKELEVINGQFAGDFMATIASYSLKCLQNIYDCCQGCIDVLIEQGVADQKTWADSSPNLYDRIYMDYYNKLNALAYEISVREKEIDVISSMIESAETERNAIQDALDLQKFLGDIHWRTLSSYRRDDTYSNSNYVSDGLSNSELFDNALKFLETAQKEIKKASEIQYTLSSTLKNLLVIKEFRKLVDYFEVGNWIRVEIDNRIYKLRLISYSINFDDLETLNVEFSDVTDYKKNVLKIDDILTVAQTMATSYDYIERQAEKGKTANEQLKNIQENGFDASTAKIMNSADDQDVVYDSHGILLRKYDEFMDSYLPTQLKIINSTLAVTTDNWKTTKAAIGNFLYRNPETGEVESVYGINAELVVGKLLLGQGLGLYNSAGTLTFDENGFNITNGKNGVTINPNSDSLLVLSNQEGNILWVDVDGTLHIVGDGSVLDISTNDTTNTLRSEIQQKADSITSTVEKTYETKSDATDKLGTAKGYADAAEANANNATDEKLKNYSTTVQMRSEIQQKADSITSTVEKTTQSKYNTFDYDVALYGFGKPYDYRPDQYLGQYYLDQDTGELYQAVDNFNPWLSGTGYDWEVVTTLPLVTDSLIDMSTQITQTADSIKSLVKKDEFGTLVEQNYEHVRISWNNISNYIQFSNGELNIYSSNTLASDDLLMRLSYNGEWFYYKGTRIGKIGTNSWTEHPDFRGLVFDLEAEGGYMTWSSKNSPDDTLYYVRIAYFNTDYEGIGKRGFHIQCPAYLENTMYLTNTVRIKRYDTGAAIETDYTNNDFVGIGARNVNIFGKTTDSQNVFFRCDGELEKFIFYNSSTDEAKRMIDCFNNIDIHGFSILNQSDARLKTNIKSTNVKGLEKLNQIELKEFDWIEDGLHEDIGMIAQQVSQVIPNLVFEDKTNGKLSIKENKFIAYIIKAIQELYALIQRDDSIATISTLSSNTDNNMTKDSWDDTYSLEEKLEFLEKIKPNMPEEQKELVPVSIALPQ